MKLSKFFKFFLPSDDDEMLISQVSQNFEQIDTALNTLKTDKADSKSPTFTGVPKVPTAKEGTETTQIASTAFVMSAINKLQKTVDTLAETALNGLYVKYLFNKEKYGTVNSLGRKITLSQYENGTCNLPPQWVADGVTLPEETKTPVISGVTTTANDDETICYEMLLYSNGEIWSRQAVLWWYQGGETGQYGEWQNNVWVNEFVAPGSIQIVTRG